MPTTNGGQSALEVAAIAARARLIPNNTYNNFAAANTYTATHTRALADSTTPVQGKGTGGFLDIENYNAGGDYDINGNAATAIGSGRKAGITLNMSTWGFGPGSNYVAPDTSANTGQVTI